jgi:ergothioneine biosynthesis protein EgtB
MALPVTRRLERTAPLREQFLQAWNRSDEIFGIVKAQAILAKPILWRHPFIFYVGHLPAFAWNQICGGVLGWESVNPGFDDLFSRGIDPDVETGECHAHPDVPQSWPDLKSVLGYRDRVRAAVLDSFDAVLERAARDVMAEQGRIFHMVLEHEYMHQETLLYMLQEAPQEIKQRLHHTDQYQIAGEATGAQMTVPGGNAGLGARFDALEFGWDNEFPEFNVEVPEFRMDSLPVTNGRFLEFVESGGYANPRWWLQEDWRWKVGAGLDAPNVWRRVDGRWLYRTVFDLLPLEQVLSWPVYVSLAEARSYARWRGARLPTEPEFHRAAYGAPRASFSTSNLGFARWSPSPVGVADDDHAFGIKDLIGNGWEWTTTPFQPFPGFSPYIAGYKEYSADFFDNKHFVLKGGSWATALELVRPSFRNWYQAHYPYVFAKFRCVVD